MVELGVEEVELGGVEVELEVAWEGFWLADVCLCGFGFVFGWGEEGTTEITEDTEGAERGKVSEDAVRRRRRLGRN